MPCCADVKVIVKYGTTSTTYPLTPLVDRQTEVACLYCKLQWFYTAVILPLGDFWWQPCDLFHRTVYAVVYQQNVQQIRLNIGGFRRGAAGSSLPFA